MYLLSKKAILSERDVPKSDIVRNYLFNSKKLVFHKLDLLNI